MARHFTTLDPEAPQNSSISSPAIDWGIVLIVAVAVVWLVRKRRPVTKTFDPTATAGSLESRPPHFTQALHWLGYAKSLERSQQYEEAIAVYEQGLQDHPQDYRLWHEHGLVLAKLQRFEEAIASYDRAYQLRPQQQDLAHERGDALLELERYEEAIASLNVFLRYAPDNAHVLTDRGYALCQLQRYEEALQSLNWVLKNEPRDRDSLMRARYYQIEALCQLGRLEAALQSSQEATKQHTQEFFKAQQAKLRHHIACITPDEAQHP
jgi:tetratricopeptide (TPR) repeat protein